MPSITRVLALLDEALGMITPGLTITGIPLPNDPKAPYTSVGGSKHTNMAMHPGSDWLIVQGGDWEGSATDGTWAYNLKTGEHKQVVGKPRDGVVAPHALQDGAGFEWDQLTQSFLTWPGGYFPYEPVGAPIRDLSRGLFRLTLIDGAWQWTQDLRLWGEYGQSSGCAHGGVFDPVTRCIYVMGDASSGYAVRRWDVDQGVRLPDVPLKLPAGPAGTSATYYRRSRYALLGRHIYFLGYATDGTKAVQVPRFFRWSIDAQSVAELAPPPGVALMPSSLETRLARLHDKVLWPKTSGPDGEIDGLFVYDPASNVWTVDRAVPTYGNFICNSIATLADGRVAMCGGTFGRQQTHLWIVNA